MPVPACLPRPAPRRAFIVAFAALFVAGPVAAADDNTERLLEIQREIRQGQEKLSSSQAQLDRLHNRIAASERQISDLSKRLRASARRLREAQAGVERLEQRAAELSSQARGVLSLLGAELRALHRDGDLGDLRYQLSFDDWSELERRNVYSDYFRRARKQRLGQIRGELSELASVHTALLDKRAALAKQEDERRRRLDALTREKQERDNAGRALEAEIKQMRGGLAMLEQDAARLRGLMERLDRAPPAPATQFRTLKGRLPWPVAGRAAVRKHGRIYRGVFLDATPDTPVRSIHQGRVVFSDWIRGYGLMVIVDHGRGYMSLYGNNKALYKTVGDAVTAGEQLAVMNDPVAQRNNGLYFEIRHRGKPLDPREWCR